MEQQNVLVIGGGGREHAISWALARSPQVKKVYVAPGNAGTQWSAGNGLAAAETVSLAADDITNLVGFAQTHDIALTIVGPEVPLAAGLVDIFQDCGLRVFGPVKAAARLEASKAFAKDFMHQHGIPTAAYSICDQYDAAHQAVVAASGYVVVKADGLAAGKGVFVCDTLAEAEDALHLIMQQRIFGEAGDRVVIEERLTGREISVLAFTDGNTIIPMPMARDYKRAYDHDHGPNTGGMGAYAPASDISQAQIDEIIQRVLLPTIQGLAAQGTRYVGVLYAGLMLTDQGMRVLEFNCRFGDPETQVLLPLLETDLYDLANACLDSRLAELEVRWRPGFCATVVLASAGYPNSYVKGFPIQGLQELHGNDEVLVFHAGTAQSKGQVVTAGGRVLAISALGRTLPLAVHRAYVAADTIQFERSQMRRDIGRVTV